MSFRNAAAHHSAAARDIEALGSVPGPEPAPRDGLGRRLAAIRTVRHDVVRDWPDHDRRLIDELCTGLARGLPAGQVAVLCRTAHAAGRYRRILHQAGFATEALGGRADAVRVGTMVEARGRTWAAVLLPADDTPTPVLPYLERRRLRDERMTAMTAARERLWLGTLDPSSGLR
jgi:hypothetical protein